MGFRKDAKERIAKMESRLENLSNDNIRLKYQIETSDIRASISGMDKFNDELDRYEDELIFNQIMDNKIPKELSFDYWKLSQQLDMFWLGRYMEFDHEYKDAILAAMLIAIRFGLGAYCKSNNKPYYISESEEDGYYECWEAYDLLHKKDAFTPTEDGAKLSDSYLKAHDGKKIASSDLVICTWRFGNIGNFVWYMKEVCLWIYLNRLIGVNASSMINKLYVKVNNLANHKKEYKRLLNPFKQIAYIIADTEIKAGQPQNITADANKILNGEIAKHGMDGNIASLINTSKYQLETLCWMFGIPVTSSKNQDLSSEASFSHSTSRNIAKDHDRRITRYLKALGINIVIKDPEMLVTENQNADKEATGTANTENQKNKNKAENDNGSN